jgi:hypothetical protein
MNKTLRTKSSNNRIVILLMILGLFALFMSGCGQPAEPAKNATNTAPANAAPGANKANANTATSNAGSNTNTASNSTTAASTGACGEAPGDDEVYIYEHIFSSKDEAYRKSGKCVKLTAGEYKDAAAMGLADNMMSSIKVGKNVHAVVCTDANFGGTCMAFDKDDDNFLNNATLKNDTASSVKVSKAEICSPQSADKPVTLKWTNKTDKNLRIVWVNYECKERNEPREVERKIKPGDVMEEASFVTHIFHVTNFDTNESYGYIYVNESNAVHEIKDIK